MRQGAAPLPVFRRRLGMDHQRIALWTLEEAIGLAGEGVGRHAIGEGELIGGVEVIFVLTWMSARLGEAVIQDDAPAAGHMWGDASEDLAPLDIFIKAMMDELAQKTAALRTPPAVGLVDTNPAA